MVPRKKSGLKKWARPFLFTLIFIWFSVLKSHDCNISYSLYSNSVPLQYTFTERGGWGEREKAWEWMNSPTLLKCPRSLWNVARTLVTPYTVRIDFADWLLIHTPSANTAVPLFLSTEGHSSGQALCSTQTFFGWSHIHLSFSLHVRELLRYSKGIWCFPCCLFSRWTFPRFFICSSSWGVTGKTKSIASATQFPPFVIPVQGFYKEMTIYKERLKSCLARVLNT